MADSIFLGSVYGTLEMHTAEWTKGVESAKRDLDQMEKTVSSKMSSIGSSFVNAGKTLSIGLTAPLVLFGKTSVDTAVEIETKWKEVQKVYGSTAGAFQKDQEMLSAAVDNLSVKFGVQKDKTLDALGALAAMGFEGQKAVNMLTESMGFAVTGNMEMNQAMEATVAISKIYGVEGEKLHAVIAMLNTVENSTGASMADLAEAISTAGSSAKVAGVSVDELSAFVAALRERAIPAGEAANALKTIFTRVYNVTDAASEVYKKYGITIDETTKKTIKYTDSVTTNTAQVAEGTKTTGKHAVKLTEVQKEYQRLGSLMESNRKKMTDITNGYTMVNASEDERKKKIGELNKEYDNMTKRMADLDKQYTVTTGSGKELTKVIEVKTGKFKDADVVIQEIAKNWNKMTDAEKYEVIQSNAGIYQRDKFVALMMDMNSQQSTYLKTLGAVGDETQNLTTYEKEMAIFLDTSKVKLAQSTVAFNNMKTEVGAVILEALVPFMAKLAELAKWFSGLSENTQRWIVGIGALLAALGPILIIVGNVIKAVGLIQGAITALTPIITGLFTWITATAIPAIGAFVVAFWPVILIAAAVGAALFLLWKNWETVSTWVSEKVTWLTTTVVTLFNQLKERVSSNVANLGMYLTATWTIITETIRSIQIWFNDVMWTAWNNFTSGVTILWEGLTQFLETTWSRVTTNVVAIASWVWETIKWHFNQGWEFLKQIGSNILEAIVSPFRNAYNAVADLVGKILSKIREVTSGTSGNISVSHRAVGGPVTSGETYMVGERGPELFTPNVSGRITPNNKLGSVGSSAPTFNVNIGVYAGTEMEKRALAKTLFDSYDSYLRLQGRQLAYEPA